MIHVKSADSAAPSRSVAVSPFEVVAGQAVKNSRLLIEPEQLREPVDMPHGSQRAAWTDGRRVTGRSEFLARLDDLPPDKRRVVIVQPHVSEGLPTGAFVTEADPGGGCQRGSCSGCGC
jgi:hypothetical protein